MKNLLVFLTMMSTVSLARADMGANYPIVGDSQAEYNAKQGASNIGITQIYDHSNQVSNGQFYVPITYNRTDMNAAEHDPFYSKSDIDYVPLNQLKGANGTDGTNGINGAAGVDGVSGTNGSNGEAGIQGEAGEKGQKGDKGNNGTPGKDANVETRLLLGVAVQIASERYFDVHMFTDYDVTNSKVGFFGARILFKPGKSYESRQIEKLRKEIRDANLKMEVVQ